MVVLILPSTAYTGKLSESRYLLATSCKHQQIQSSANRSLCLCNLHTAPGEKYNTGSYDLVNCTVILNLNRMDDLFLTGSYIM